MKILLAVDGSDYSEAAVAGVSKRPWPVDSQIKVLSVIEPFTPYMTEIWATSNEFWEELDKASKDQAQMAVNTAVEQLSKSASKSLVISTEIIKGNPKNAILDEAERWGADLIVLG